MTSIGTSRHPEDALRRAAALMRERAQAATSDGHPWVARPHFSRRDCVTVQTRGQTYLAHYLRAADATYIASWHPAVALAVAAWLDHEATAFRSRSPWLEDGHHLALTLAHAYLGTES